MIDCIFPEEEFIVDSDWMFQRRVESFKNSHFHALIAHFKRNFLMQHIYLLPIMRCFLVSERIVALAKSRVTE